MQSKQQVTNKQADEQTIPTTPIINAILMTGLLGMFMNMMMRQIMI